MVIEQKAIAWTSRGLMLSSFVVLSRGKNERAHDEVRVRAETRSKL
jgi:hypothetical protein